MKSIIFNIISVFIYFIPIKFLIKLTGIKIIYPFYHIVSNNPPPHIKHLYPVKTEKQFRKDLDFLTKYFQNTKDVLLKSPDKQNHFYLSFDDGLRECYTVIAPILDEYNIKATFFVNSAFVDNKDLFFRYKASILIHEILNKSLSEKQKTELSMLTLSKKMLTVNAIKRFILNINYFQKNKLDDIAKILNINFKNYLQEKKPYLSESQIKILMEKGHQIGAHSIDHPLYSDLKTEEQIKQTSESIKFLKENFDVKYKLFAFPFTDKQVKPLFFNTVFEKNIMDYSFGTSGIKKSTIKNHIQRIPIEKKSISIKRHIKTEYFLCLVKKIIRKK